MSSLSENDIRRIAEAVRKHDGKIAPAARETGYNWHTVNRYGNAMSPVNEGPPEPRLSESDSQPEPEPDPIEETRRRLEEERDRKRERELLLAIAGEKSFRAFLESLMLEVAPRIEPPPPYAGFATSADTSEETMMLVWSDWHAYEVVKEERVLGLNRYDAETMGRRVKHVVDSSLSIKDRMERGAGWRFRRCVVACNGDFVSGTIHEVERHGDAPNVIMAVYGTGLTLAEALRDLAPHFERIDVYCTSGNHGRLPDARRMQQKDPSRNWDTAIYLYAKTALRALPNIHFHIPDSYSVMYDVRGWNFLQTHGHEIKSWNSIPFYGIDRYGRNINALLTANAMPIHYFVISHFHSGGGLPSAGGESFINGSLIGGTEYSINGLGKSDRPMQWMFSVHDQHGVASRWPIYGNGGTDSYPVRPWESN